MNSKSKGDSQHDKLEISGGANSSLGSFESGDGIIFTDVEGHEYINMSFKENIELSPEQIKKSEKFISSLKAITNMYPVKVHVDGSGFSLFFHKRNPESFSEMKERDVENAAWFYRSLLKEGVCFSTSQDETNYVTAAHTDQQLRLVIIGVQRALSYVYGYVDNM